MKQKKPYSQPALTELTQEQAMKLVAERKNRSDEYAAEFLQALRETAP